MSKEHPPVHSTGRGGAGNIGPDDTVYVDGDIVREGTAGEPSHPGGGDYSSGRGGAGNIVPSPRSGTPSSTARPAPGGGTPADLGSTPASVTPGGSAAAHGTPAHTAPGGSDEVVPEPAMHKPGEQYADFHTGRGGQGNVHRDKYGGHSKPQPGQEGYHEGILEKAKHAVGMGKKEGEEGEEKK